MKKILCLVLIFLMMLCSSSCRFKDIDRRAFIIAIGLDLGKSGDAFDLSVKVAIPKTQQDQGSGGNQENFILYKASDRSIGSGLRKIKAQMSLDPDFSHLKAVVISKDLTSRFSLKEINSYFVRRSDIQQIAWLMVGEPSAQAIINTMPKGENIAGNYLFMKFGQGVQPQFVNITETYQAFADLSVPGKSVSCPVIEVKNKSFVAKRTAIFRGGKLKTILDMDQTRLLNILELGLNVGFLTLNDENKSPIGIRFQQAKGKVSLHEKSQGDLTCMIDIQVKALLEESAVIPNNTGALEKKFEALLTKQAYKLMSDLQENGLDPLGLQVKYWARHPKYKFSEAWLTDIYPKIKFKVNTKVKILQPETLK